MDILVDIATRIGDRPARRADAGYRHCGDTLQICPPRIVNHQITR
jgi:hypothetical protein